MGRVDTHDAEFNQTASRPAFAAKAPSLVSPLLLTGCAVAALMLAGRPASAQASRAAGNTVELETIEVRVSRAPSLPVRPPADPCKASPPPTARPAPRPARR